ncbi:MAG: thioredoxin [Sporocytophaga sp.]|uniref:thioredoxin n=1 Tax=Sporocytophaga sp. TaxID=2231183 RepID=UPI001B1922B5|nr:thioredoxin [Sporocytophaga sp.]MBO9700737.1 thioredoxin [Sporocytophaga sp.]
METKTKLNFADLISNSDKPVLVDFYADWCGPCQAMAPMIAEIADEMSEKIKVIKVDVEKNPAVSTAYKISGIPTLILFHKGQIKWRQSGLIPKPELLRMLTINL